MGDFKSGDIVAGRYRVLDSLGAGSAGHTYSAESVATGDRVALKCFKLRGADSWKSLELFEREAKVLAKLDHPDIPRLYESFSEEGPDGPTFYLAQALVPGESLAAFVRDKGTIDEGEARRIADRLLIVLAYMHALSPAVVHRDLKPANIVRRPDGSLALVDFGAVRVAAPQDAPGTTVVGTYGFMAPEQFRGAATPGTDLYAVGATLVFMLTGRSPDQLPQKKLRPELPKALPLTRPFRDWLDKMLEPAPEDRFASAGLALMALRTGKIPKASSGAGARVAVLGGVLAVAVLGGGGFIYWSEVRGPVMTATVTTPLPDQGPILGIPGQLLPEPDRKRYAPLREEKHFHGHANAAMSVSVSPDGKLLASSGYDGAVKLWSTDTWAQLASLPGPQGKSFGVRFSRDGALLAAGAPDGVFVWRTDTKELLGRGSSGAQIVMVEFSPDGKELHGNGFDGSVHTWSLPGLGASTKRPLGIGRLNGLATTPSFLFAVSQEGRASRWPASGDGARFDLEGHSAPYSQVVVSPDQSLVAAPNDDGYTSVWSTSEARPVFHAHSATRGEAWGAAFSPDGSLLATTSQAGDVALWKVPDGRFLGSVQWDDKRGTAGVTFTPDGTRLITSNGSGGIWVLKVTDQGEPLPIPTPPAGLKHEELPPGAPLAEQARFLIASYSGNRRVLDEALAVCNQALAANPRDAAALVQRGRAKRAMAMRTGYDYDLDLLAEGTADLDQALAIEPRNLRARTAKVWHALLAARTRAYPDQSRIDLTEVHTAFAALEELGQADTLVDDLRVEIATVERRFDEAVVAATRMIEHAKNLEEVDSGLQTLCDVYTKTGRFRAADALWRKRVELKNSAAWVLGDYARFLLLIGDDGNAMSRVEEALQKMDYGVGRATRADIWADRATSALWDLRMTGRAKEYFEKALADDSRNETAIYGLIAVDWFVATGKDEKCDDCVERLQTLAKRHPDFPTAKQALAQLGVK